MAYQYQQQIIESVFRNAVLDNSEAESFVRNSAQVFRESGLLLSETSDEQFNSYLKEIAGEELQKIEKARAGQTIDPNFVITDPAVAGLAKAGSATESLFFISPCTICEIGAFAISTSIVAIGAAGLAVLTVKSGVVIALAAFASVSAKAALAFIVTLGTAVNAGVSAVSKEICEWIDAC